MFKIKPAIAILIASIALELNKPNSYVLGATETANPLEIERIDPLLPNRSSERPLSPLEKYKLEREILKLEQKAKTESEEISFEIWYRILRLKRELGLLAEIEALGNVGAIAWDKSRARDVTIITQRLKAIEQDIILTRDKDLTLSLALGQAYRQLRDFDLAIAIYERILTDATKLEDNSSKIETLKLLGELYLTKFDYSKAAPVYEELLNNARSSGDNFNTGIYLTQLAKIYDRIALPENALPIKERLQQKYLNSGKLQDLVKLKISIGEDYEAIQEPEKANANYQEAFNLAWSLQNLAAASLALEKLANLYLDYNQPLAAVEIYQQLIKVQQQSYNFFGLMSTYDRIGKIYLDRENFSQAIEAFQKGKEIARTLQYRENYFIDRINTIKQEIRKEKVYLNIE
ncbi:MAG: tetratricopeptide repeat protein [Prochloraceae cyanobacterium]